MGTSGLRICHGQNMVYAIGYDHPTIIRDFLQWDVLGMLTPMNILLLEDDHHLSWENKPTFHISHWSFWALYPFTPKQLAHILNVPSISSTASYTTIHGFVWRIGYLGFQRKIKNMFHQHGNNMVIFGVAHWNHVFFPFQIGTLGLAYGWTNPHGITSHICGSAWCMASYGSNFTPRVSMGNTTSIDINKHP